MAVDHQTFQRLHTNIQLTAGWLNQQTREFLAPYGITPKQFNILRILRGQHPGDLPIQEIRQRMIDKMSDTSRLVDRLVKKQWVEKRSDDDDRRSQRVRITPKGLQLLTAIDDSMQQAGFDTIPLDKAEVLRLNELLDKLRG